jgi:hypothetical protein
VLLLLLNNQGNSTTVISLRKALLDALHCDAHRLDVIHPGIAAAEEARLRAMAALACKILIRSIQFWVWAASSMAADM